MYSYRPPYMAKQKQDDQLERTYSSYMRIQDVALKTCQRRWTIGRSGERDSGISVLAARHDDDDDEMTSHLKHQPIMWHHHFEYLILVMYILWLLISQCFFFFFFFFCNKSQILVMAAYPNRLIFLGALHVVMVNKLSLILTVCPNMCDPMPK